MRLASTGLIATQGQFFHSLAHRNPKENNAFIRFLQKHHIILNPQFHNKHHTAPYESHFSVLTGRMNSVVDLIVNNGGWSVCKFFANPAKQD